MPPALDVDFPVGFRAGGRELVRARRLLGGLSETSDAVCANDLGGHGRRADDLVAELLAVADSVAVGREHGIGRRGRIDPAVADEQTVRDRALAAGIRGPVQHLAVEGHRRRVAGLEAGGRDTTEPDEFLRQLVVREADAVADPAAVCGHEHDRAVATLADCGASEPRCEHHGGEVLKSTEHGLAVADEQRPAADRVDVVRPAGAEQVADNDTRAGRRLGVELLGRAAGRRQDRSAGRNRRVAALTELDDVAAQVDAGRQHREGVDDRLGRARRGGRGATPGRRVQRDPALVRRLVQARQRPALAATLPERVPGCVADVERPGRLDPDTRPFRVRQGCEHPVLHHDPVRPTVRGVEEVAVDARDRRRRRGLALDPGQALAPGDRAVGEPGA